jgi:hypothetical protein
VVIRGGGMNGNVQFGIWIGASPDGTIADLTIDGVSDHGIIANYGAHDMLFHNLRIVDSGDQFIKSNPNGADGNDRGIVEYSVFEYRTTGNDFYTEAVDIHAGDGWIVRYNLFRNILAPVGQGLAGNAVLAWNGSSNTVVEGNTFINVARGISLGLVDKSGGFDHQGGLIANNTFYRDPSLPQDIDVPIMVADSPNTKVLHNTVITRGDYPNAIEYRFASSNGLQIRNNLSDAGIQARDGAAATVSGNTTNAQLNWFVNPTAGDLHLLSSAPVIDQASVLADVPLDIDGQSRGSNPDVGADEFGSSTPGDTTPPVISLIVAGNITVNGATITWSTNEASDTQVEYGLTTAYGSQTTLNTAMATSHSAQLSGLTTGTLYHYRVKSRDAAGNLSVSSDRTFTTTAASGGLISQFTLDEGSGRIVTDNTGRTGTISGARWATGQSGSGLNFDGRNDWVTVADDNRLDLTNRLTIAAWVRPDVATKWRTVLIKETSSGLAYGLYASEGSGRPNVYITTEGGGMVGATASQSLPVGVWSHLAATYDGNALRLYVNGQLAATRAVSGNVVTSSSPLRFGGSSVWGEYFDGRMDDLRLYDLSLTASQIAQLAASANQSLQAQTESTTAAEDTALFAAEPTITNAAIEAPQVIGAATESGGTFTAVTQLDGPALSTNDIGSDTTAETDDSTLVDILAAAIVEGAALQNQDLENLEHTRSAVETADDLWSEMW